MVRDYSPRGGRAGTLMMTACMRSSCLLSAVVLACADAPHPDASWRGTIDTTETGLIRVSNPQDAPVLGLVEELRIGRQSGAGPDVFGEIAAVGVSPKGEIYVIDEHAQEVRVFAPDGAHVRTFGGRGGGPGELEGAFSLERDGQGRLWITDPGNNRYAVYDSIGTLLFHATRRVPGVVFPWLGGIGPDGLLYDLGVNQPEDGLTQYTWYRVERDGTVITPLPPFEYRRSGPPFGSLTLFRVTPHPTFAFDPRGFIWIASTGDYRIWQRTLDGDTVREITRAHTRAEVTQAQRDSIAAELAMVPPQFREASIPELAPALDRVLAGENGFVYVVRPGRDTIPTIFDVFDADGRLIGTVRSGIPLATFLVLPRFANGRIYGVTHDSLGVSYVVRLRIE